MFVYFLYNTNKTLFEFECKLCHDVKWSPKMKAFTDLIKFVKKTKHFLCVNNILEIQIVFTNKVVVIIIFVELIFLPC